MDGDEILSTSLCVALGEEVNKLLVSGYSDFHVDFSVPIIVFPSFLTFLSPPSLFPLPLFLSLHLFLLPIEHMHVDTFVCISPISPCRTCYSPITIKVSYTASIQAVWDPPGCTTH